VTTVEKLASRFYPGYVDEQVRFDALIRSYLEPAMVILDAGAGRGTMFPHDYRRTAARVVGADIDPDVKENANLTEAVVADLAELPYVDASFDLAFSKFVFEHLDRPIAVMRELRRVMKPGAHLLVHTPNRWHYVALAATVTPTRFHAWFNDRMGREDAHKHTFPTRYRINGSRTIRRAALATGFRVVSIELFETSPGYLAFHPVPYLAGIAYERLVNRFSSLARFRVQILADLEAL
jgi:SAM-dependent methyltransferase